MDTTDYITLHHALSEAVAVKVNGDQLCFPNDSEDAGTVYIETDNISISLNFYEPLPTVEIEPGVYLVDFGDDFGKVEIQPLYGKHSFPKVS